MEPSHLSPNFVIPVGTQVVLKCDLDVMGAHTGPDGNHLYKKSGSVGVVDEAPLTNEYPYFVQFADGHIVRAARDKLAVRRSISPEDELPEREHEVYEKHVIYRVRLGSRAFGLSDENSDTDERGVFLPPAEWHWSLQPLPEQIEFKRMADGRILDHNSKEGGDDFCWWELEKFLRLALKANPNVLEALFVGDEHVLHCDAWGKRLRELRPVFLSKYLYQTYSGYVLSQFKKMKRSVESGETHRPKHAMHLIRLLYSGIEALKGNGILVDVGPYRAELLRIKHENVPFAEIYAKALELNLEFQKQFETTTLSDRPDVAAVDRFLIEARRSRI
jgi:predicted nucleotidyltransferase